MYPTAYPILAEVQTLSPWLQEVAQRRISQAFSLPDARIQGMIQRAFDWIIHLFLYHLNLNQTYCAFYDRLRENIPASASYPQEHPATLISDFLKPFFCFDEQMVSPTLTPPIGFSNYGNACWLAAPLQILLTLPWFEQSARMPLEQQPDENDLTFQARQKAKASLVDIIDLRKQSNCNCNTMSAALRKLHESIRRFDDTFPPVGYADDSNAFLYAIATLLDCHPDLKTTLTLESQFQGNSHPEYGLSSQLIISMGNYTLQVDDANRLIPIPFDEDLFAVYRIAGIIKHTQRHWISFVQIENQWYRCDDHRITPRPSLQGISIGNNDKVIFERVEF